MIITYIRSSSYNTWDMCNFQYFLEYSLGWRAPSGKAADIGTISHKVCELLAKQNLAIKKGLGGFEDDELNRYVSVEETLTNLIEMAWEYYVNGPAKHHTWTKPDKKKVYGNIYDFTTYQNGSYNPLNLNIIEVEKYFDIEITEPWAKYEYENEKGEMITGNLAIKGTMDLVTHDSDKVLQYIDWKTGRRYDWAKEKEKDLDDLYNDFQIRLYHYALNKLYPQYSLYCMSFFYNNYGGPFHCLFDNGEHEKVMTMLKNRYLTIKKNTNPKRHLSWKCSKLCHFGKTKDKDSKFYKGSDPDKMICTKIFEELQEIGLEKLTKKYGGLEKASAYGSGGGVQNREEKDKE